MIKKPMASRSLCPNCKSVLSCGCQLKTASDGKRVCNSCKANYELTLKQKCQTPIVQTVITAK
jgi:hypothetical protein